MNRNRYVRIDKDVYFVLKMKTSLLWTREFLFRFVGWQKCWVSSVIFFCTATRCDLLVERKEVTTKFLILDLDHIQKTKEFPVLFYWYSLRLFSVLGQELICLWKYGYLFVINHCLKYEDVYFKATLSSTKIGLEREADSRRVTSKLWGIRTCQF